ncbi:PilZ domain-containing protein [Candidatus Colwellia aromaticivorans]|uniref:PilZ domain-containing protein n=1 Tax=Candidatus Colwellia aromaticivorans TaxID=2267621 RepID=UPI000DF3D35D|nr:PilZ domain-containing protein [Candidatus Colwellia aromaticivorans]
MNNETIEKKLAKYHEFFSIEHNFSINILPLELTKVASFEQFLVDMPTPFKMASDMKSIDQSALRPLQALSGVAGQLVEFLNHQSSKIDLLIGYILSQQDDEEHRYQGIKFGGGGLLFTANTAFKLAQFLEMKIFLLNQNCAVFCYGEVIEVQQEQESYLHKVIFHFIREDDREILVRNSLHEQSKQLQVLAQQRNQEGKI